MARRPWALLHHSKPARIFALDPKEPPLDLEERMAIHRRSNCWLLAGGHLTNAKIIFLPVPSFHLKWREGILFPKFKQGKSDIAILKLLLYIIPIGEVSINKYGPLA